jgi:hypothetical protein
LVFILPVLLLLAGAALTGLFRRASSFYLWAITVASAFLAWLSLLLSSSGKAGLLDVSVWRPEPLFSAELVLGLGRTQWDVVYAAMTLLMALVLTAPARDGGERAADWALFLVYGSLSLLAMMAGNLLTLSLLLIVLDISAFVYVLRSTDAARGGQQAILKLAVESIGVLLLLTAGLVATLERGGGRLTTREAMALDLMLALGVVMRLGLIPLPLGLPPRAAARRGIGALMRLMPPAILMVQLGMNWPDGAAGSLRGWLILVGAIAALTAGVAWAFSPAALGARAQLVACAAGLALIAGGSAAEIAPMMSALAVLLMLAGGMASVADMHTPFHRLWPALLAVTCLGLPLTPSGGLLRDLPSAGGGASVLGGIVGIGLGLLSAGVAMISLMPEAPWKRAEGYSRLLFGAGLALFPVAAIGYGLRQGVEISAATGIGLGASLVTILLVVLIRRRRLEAGIRRAERIVGWLDVSPLVRGAWRLYQEVLGIAGGVGYALEGEGAFLWVMALAALAAALLAGAGR